MDINHIYTDRKDITKSLVEITIDENTTTVQWWYSLSKQFSETELNDYFYAEALKNMDKEDVAIAYLATKASGALTYQTLTDDDGNEYQQRNDTRNWYQRWIDENKN